MEAPILGLPVELRLHIYSFVLDGNPTLTIGTAKIKGPHSDIIHRLYGEGRKPYAGIPEHHEPVIESGYNASLLSAVNPAATLRTPLTSDTGVQDCAHGSHLVLRLVNRQFNEELTRHFKAARSRNTTLFIQYPHGLHVCKTSTPHLLTHARSVHIAGSYMPANFCPARAACLAPPRQQPSGLSVKYNGNKRPDSLAQLSDLITSLFCPEPRMHVEKFEMRIYYPGDNSYSTVWGDDNSPTVLALRHIHFAEVDIEVWRGRQGTGVYLTAKRAAERKRVVSTVWRKLEEGRHEEPACGSWVVDPKWPKWEEEYEMSVGPKGDMLVTRAS